MGDTPERTHKSAHEFARELLAGPDLRAVIAVAVFDSPGEQLAYSVAASPVTIENVPCIVVHPKKLEKKAA